MKILDLVNQYNIKAKEFALEYGIESNHVANIISSVMMTRDGKGLEGGGFVKAVVANDLFMAVNNADSVCYENLKVIVAANEYAYLD